jgi:predicted amidophosphoribosyltransferase
MSICNPFSFTLHTLLQPFLCIGCGGLQYRPLCGFCAELWIPLREPMQGALAETPLYALWFGNTVTYRAFRQWKLTGAVRLSRQLNQIHPELLEKLRAQRFQAIVPIPQDPRRSWRRGFESARLVAEVFGTALQVPLLSALELRPGTSDQNRANRGRLDRMLSPNPFRVRENGPLPERVLIVDDVVTTGSTLEHAVIALSFDGRAREIAAASLVYKPPGQPLHARKRVYSSLVTGVSDGFR